MNTSINKISTVVSEQFPEFYLEDGPNFIQFVKTYYEWMEQDGKILDTAYEFPSYLDIDTTLDRFIDHFKQTYMVGLPKEILGNPRFVQKHILDIYRSKGSPESVKLLFRLLYNEDISIYVPSVDIFRLDDGKWVERRYIELDAEGDLRPFEGKEIIGLNSKARGFVATYERRTYDQGTAHIFYLENIRGTFLAGEPVYYQGLTLTEAPQIRGSVTGLNLVSSARNFVIGNELYSTTESRGLKFKITGTRSQSTGVIEASLLDGGTGYTMNAVVTVTTNSNTAGSGASFKVGAIANTTVLYVSNTLIDSFDTVLLNASDYGFLGSTTNVNSTLLSALSLGAVNVGTISRLDTLSPGSGYDGNVNITVYDSITGPFSIPDGSGKIWGNNAVITDQAVFGNNLAASVKVVSSGFRYYTQSESKTLSLSSNTSQSVTGELIIGGVGKEEGYYQGSGGFLDANKYLADDYYYQEFSYEVLSQRSLDKYSAILKQVVHPAGNELFGRPRIAETVTSTTSVIDTITQVT